MVKLSGYGFTEGGLSLVPLKATSASKTADRVYMQVHEQGNSSQNKVVLLFGDDTACKASLKDAFVNYIYQTQNKDTYRFVLLDDSALEKDPRIKAYVFNRTEETLLPFNLILIDVPALGGLHSAEADIRTLLNLERFLLTQFNSTSVSAVNFVAPSSNVFFRPFINTYNLLNHSFEKLEMLAQIIVTNSPTHMPFISSLRRAKVSYNNLFTFYTENQKSDDDDQFLSQIYLLYDYPGVDDFFQELNLVPPSNMSLVRKVDAGLVVPADIGRLRVVNQFSETRGYRFGLSFRQLYMKLSFKDETTGLQIYSMGKTNDRSNVIVILVGNRNSGKTTVATALANRLFGIKSQDNYRLLIDDDLINSFGKCSVKESTTTTAYFFKHVPGIRADFNFIIVDSVGFGGPEEKQQNKTAVMKITKLLKNICKSDFSVHVLFVAPGMQSNLPTPFKTIHRQLLSITDKKIERITFVDAYTYNQGSPVPMVLKKLESMPVSVFKFDSGRSTGQGGTSHGAKNEEVFNDMNWIIEHHTLEKVFGQLQL